MRVMLDTNIFISAVLFPRGRTALALQKALNLPYQPVVCDYVIDELHRKFHEKFPDKIDEESLEHQCQQPTQAVCCPSARRARRWWSAGGGVLAHFDVVHTMGMVRLEPSPSYRNQKSSS